MKITKDMLKDATSDCKKIMADAETALDDALIPIHERMQDHTMANITANFGKFLHDSLGENITGQRHSCINPDWLVNNRSGQVAVEQAELTGTSVEDVVKGNGHRYQSHLTVGSAFGISYHARTNGRLSTIYLHPDHIFEYLTQTHASMVKNRLKRECSQDFYDISVQICNDYKKWRKRMIQLDTPIPMPIATITDLSPDVKFTGYNSSNDTLMLLDTVDTPMPVTHITIHTQQFKKWRSKCNVSTHLKYGIERPVQTYIAIGFVNVNPYNNTYTVLGNIDLSHDKIIHCLQDTTQSYSRRTLENATSNREQIAVDSITREHFGKYSSTNAGYVPLKLANCLANPEISGIIDSVLDQFVSTTEALTELKHKYAELYFVHSDF